MQNGVESPHRAIIERFFASVREHTRSNSNYTSKSDFGVRYDAAAFDTSLADSYGGGYEISDPYNDLIFSRGDIFFSGESTQTFLGDDLLRIRLSLVGEGRFEGLSESTPKRFSGRACFVIDQSPGTVISQVTDGDSRHCGVTLLLPRHLLSDVWRLSLDVLPKIFREFEEKSQRQSQVIVTSLTPELASIAAEIMQCRLKGKLLSLFLEGKAREIVAILADQLQQEDHHQLGQISLNSHDIKSLYKAHALIETNYIDPPSIDDLAHEVGLNRNKLCTGFKQQFGLPIYEYCRELRLQHAMQMLKEGDTPMVDIALQIGYQHAPAFSSAFKKRFGCSPKEFRHRGTIIPT